MITGEDIKAAINELLLCGKTVCVHSSLKSFGDSIENGAKTIVEAFLSSGCTIMAPTFSHRFEAPPDSTCQLPKRNGIDMERYLLSWETTGLKDSVYTAGCNELSRDSMGALPEYMLSVPGRVRGNHPVNSFAALGEGAEELLYEQSGSDVYAPFRKMYEHGGEVLLMGVSLCSATVIHFAEQLLGRELFIRWAKTADGGSVPVSIGSCSRGFESLRPLLEPIIKTLKVGESTWQCFNVQEAVDRCVAAMRAQPNITHCGERTCIRCEDSIAGGPVL